MNLLPKTPGIRPRVACEIAPGAVLAARSETAGGTLSSVAAVALAPGAIFPGLRPGNVVDRLAVIAGLRQAADDLGLKPNARDADVTLIVPDAAVRVLLLDFDALPNKLTEAVPILRFRLKKLVPFDTEDAMVSYQVMSSGRVGLRVLAVTMPRDVLSEYESVVREAGFEPGAVLPSTLAALAGVASVEATLVVNAGPSGVTTAITREGVLLLHRSIDLQAQPAGEDVSMPPAVRETVSRSMLELETEAKTSEIAQAVSVAVAYFEDTLAAPPPAIFSAGSLSAESLRGLLYESGYSESDGIRVRELLDASAFDPGAVSGSIPRGSLAGVAGALRV